MWRTNDKTLMVLMTFLFFMWGFITCLNDILVPHLKALFNLNYAQALLVQFCFFLTYALMSIPMAKVVSLLKYRASIILGLIISSLGCFLFLPAASFKLYPLFLFGLFVLASGIVMLQVAANPCVTLLGEPENASARLSFAQGINSLGYTIAPWLVGGLIIAYSVQIPYLFLAMALLLLSLVVFSFEFPTFETEANAQEQNVSSESSIWQIRSLRLGIIAIFVYVGAEVSAGSLIVNYLGLPDVAAMSAIHAAKYLSIYWGGAMIGRFVGSWALTFIPPNRAIAFNAVMAIVLILFSIFMPGHLAMWSILALGIFNSIMFPTIFALAIEGLGKYRNQAAGLLCAAIVGGAIIPELQGIVADHIGLRNSFFLLIFCYGFIFYYGLMGYKKVQGSKLT